MSADPIQDTRFSSSPTDPGLLPSGASSYSSSARCPECGALHHQGRWRWGLLYISAEQKVCPACRRVADGTPAGVLVVAGGMVGIDRDDILFLIHHTEGVERQDHPLRRIMGVADTAGGGIEVTTTDPRLPVALGRRLAAAHGGSLSIERSDPSGAVRVMWRRDV